MGRVVDLATERRRRSRLLVTLLGRGVRGALRVQIGEEVDSLAGWGRRWGVGRKRAQQKIRVMLGRCQDCGAPLVIARYCRSCADRENAKRRQW